MQDWRAAREDEWLTSGLTPRLAAGSRFAAACAIGVCDGWGRAYRWATYRAVLRREGAFSTGSNGPIDFNADLVKPLFDAITIKWDEIFNQYFTLRLV